MENFTNVYRSVDRPEWSLTVEHGAGYWSYQVKRKGLVTDGKGLLTAAEMRVYLAGIREALGEIELVKSKS